MKGIVAVIISLVFCIITNAQTASVAVKPTVDSVFTGKVTVVRDARLDILAKKQLEFNNSSSGSSSSSSITGPKNVKGYRLMVLNSNDRDYAMKVRALLLQNYSEQKVYMTYQAPFIKLKFGNFVNKGDADRYKRMIAAQRFVTNNIYVIQDIIEVKQEKVKEEEED